MRPSPRGSSRTDSTCGAAKRLRRKRFSPSLFVVHFSTRGTWPEVPHHSILFGPRYEGLLNDIYRGDSLADDPALYLHHPTATDPGMAPPGKSTFYALAPVPHLGRTGIDAIADFMKHLGLGARTGIDLPGEAPGRIADRHWKRAYYESQKDYYCELSAKPQTADTSDFVYKFAREFCLEGNLYRAGDAVNFAIGQGDTIVTPLQLARAYGAISNGGTLYEPRVGKAIVSPEGEVVAATLVQGTSAMQVNAEAGAYAGLALGRQVAELAYDKVITEELPANEFFGDQVRDKLLYYPTVTREPFRNQGRIPVLLESGKIAADLGLPPISLENDRFMLCGSPEMLRDTRVYFDKLGMTEGNMSTPGHFVIERAFAEQ